MSQRYLDGHILKLAEQSAAKRAAAPERRVRDFLARLDGLLDSATTEAYVSGDALQEAIRIVMPWLRQEVQS